MGGRPLCKAIASAKTAKSYCRPARVRKANRDNVLAAAHAVAAVVPPTPLLPLEHDGLRCWAKAESLQPVGAFKLRGAWWRLSSLTPGERERGVVAFSSGNHAQGVAWAARRLAMRATIVMPADAPAAKVANTQALGAEIVFYDRARESREAIASALAERSGAVLVPSFDDPCVIEGQGSAGIEIAAQLGHAPAHLVVCCGGGGLAAGLALACPDARVTVVEPEGWDDMARSLAAGEILEVAPDAPPTPCDALMTTRVSPLTFDVLRAAGATGVAVSTAEIEHAMRFAFDRLRLVVEPGGAVALAALLAGKVTPEPDLVLTLSGGNADPAYFAGVISR